MDTEDEPRVDGQHLIAPREPGSDARLSEEVRERIAQVIADWHDDDDDDGDTTWRDRLREFVRSIRD